MVPRVGLLATIITGTILMALLSSQTRAQDAVPPAKEMFSELCARCHGPQGYGDGPDGATLSTKPRNFHDCTLMGKDPDDLVFREIKGGSAAIGRSNDMPSWGAALEDGEIRNLLAYVRSFCRK